MEYQERLEFALEANQIGIWTYSEHTDTLDCDPHMLALLGARHGVPQRLAEFLALLPPEAAAAFRMLVRPKAATDTGRDVDLGFRRLDDGSECWLAMRSNSAGSSGEVVGTARDVTELRQHSGQIHLLMREVTHRSKNLLAIIQAMARQTVKDSLTAADFENRFSSRLRGLSFSHEILAAHDWHGASLEDLARGHLGSVLEQHGDRIRIGGPALFIRPEAAQNIGLALNELTSNALKYGALSGQSGHISLDWSLEAEGDEAPWLRLVWNEYGGAMIEPPLRQGFGHKVMERIVARALDGMVNMTFAPTGLRWSLRIPTEHIVRAGSGAAAA